MAIVVASHRGLEHAELLRPLLANATAMPVTEVEQGMSLEPNRVFIMPPGKDMKISRGTFDLETTPGPRGLPTTITVFLRSLSEAYGWRTVAVILSGMDKDGSAALEAIKAFECAAIRCATSTRPPFVVIRNPRGAEGVADRGFNSCARQHRGAPYTTDPCVTSSPSLFALPIRGGTVWPLRSSATFGLYPRRHQRCVR
jgi:hypothetical protein